MAQHEDLLTTAEVAERLRLSVSGVARLVRNGTIPAVRVSPRGPYRFRRSDIEALLESESVA